jgi:hypothetical protein
MGFALRNLIVERAHELGRLGLAHAAISRRGGVGKLDILVGVDALGVDELEQIVSNHIFVGSGVVHAGADSLETVSG